MIKDKTIFIVFLICLGAYFLYSASNWDSQMSDVFFHTELIDRFKSGREINDEITAFVPPNWAFSDGLNKTWNQNYVAKYPKLFHVASSLLPFDAKQSLGIMVSLLFCLLLLGIYLLAGRLGNGWASLSAVFLFLGMSGVYWNYVWFYQNMVFAQLLLNVMIVWVTLIAIIMMEKNMTLPLLLVFSLGIVGFLMSHNLIYSLEDILENITRVTPILLSIGIPTFVGATIGWLNKKEVEK